LFTERHFMCDFFLPLPYSGLLIIFGLWKIVY